MALGTCKSWSLLRARVRARVCVRVWVCACVCACARPRVCVWERERVCEDTQTHTHTHNTNSIFPLKPSTAGFDKIHWIIGLRGPNSELNSSLPFLWCNVELGTQCYKYYSASRLGLMSYLNTSPLSPFNFEFSIKAFFNFFKQLVFCFCFLHRHFRAKNSRDFKTPEKKSLLYIQKYIVRHKQAKTGKKLSCGVMKLKPECSERSIGSETSRPALTKLWQTNRLPTDQQTDRVVGKFHFK